MKKLFLVLAFALCVCTSQAQAQIDLLYSTSDSDAFAGSDLNMFLGESASMFVWVINDDLAAIDGLGIDLLSDNAAVLEATAHNINEPAGRWAATQAGTLGDLAIDTNAFALIGFGSDGIANDGIATLHSEIVFDATDLGFTNLSIAENSNLISVTGNAPQSVNFGTGTVTVAQIPEPGSLIVVSAIGLMVVTRRNRRKV
jgi:hypothetical protein